VDVPGLRDRPPDGKHGNYQLIFDTINGAAHQPSQIQTYNFPLAPKNTAERRRRVPAGHVARRRAHDGQPRPALRHSSTAWVPEQTKEQGQFGSAGHLPAGRSDHLEGRSCPASASPTTSSATRRRSSRRRYGAYANSPGDAFSDFYNKNTITTTTYRWRDSNGNGDYDPGETNLDTTCSACDFISIARRRANNLLNPDLKIRRPTRRP
jgi:hypothetical protein